MSCMITRSIPSDAGRQDLQNELNFVKIGSLEVDLALKLRKFYCAILWVRGLFNKSQIDFATRDTAAPTRIFKRNC